MNIENEDKLDTQIKEATKAAFDRLLEYHNENNPDMKLADFCLTVSARLLTIILDSGNQVMGSNMTEVVLTGIREDLNGTNKRKMAVN